MDSIQQTVENRINGMGGYGWSTEMSMEEKEHVATKNSVPVGNIVGIYRDTGVVMFWTEPLKPSIWYKVKRWWDA